jgi:hypothetical protein
MQLISGFVDTYLQLNAAEQQRFDARLAATEPLQEREVVMQIVTSWMRDGIKQGRQEALAEMVLRLLRRRFGPVSPEREARIGRLSDSDLADMGEALLDFAASADVDAWLDRRQSHS